MPRVGFVGLGVMGGRIAGRLLGAGHTVTGHNRTRAKAEWLLAEGMRWAESPRAAVEASSSARMRWTFPGGMGTLSSSVARAMP